MRLLFNKFIPLTYPEDTGAGSGGGDDTQETFELLNEEPEEVLELDTKVTKEETEEGEEKDDEDTEKDELKEIEEELEGPKEEDLELTTPVRRKEILAKYPKLFKDFPYLEKAYYREQQFTEVFPTVNDAKVAVEKAQIMDQIEQQVMGGDITQVLQAAKNENHEAFLRIADNYLPALRQVDQQAYYHVLGGVIKDTILTMVKEGRALGQQGAPLQAAANVLNQFIFGSQNFQPHTPLSRQDRPEDRQRESQLRNYEAQQFKEKFESTRDDLQSRADNVLKSTIDQNIDPNKSMTDYVRNHAKQEAFDTLETLISKDTRFRGLIDKLWEKAYEKRFDKESTDRIKAAYLSKAKTLLPTVIKKARNEALKGLGRSRDEDTEDMTPKKGPIVSGKSTAPSSGKIRKASDIPKGMSTFDVLMKD